MPNGLLDVGLGRDGPVVAGVDGSERSLAAAREAAVEAVLRGTGLELVTAASDPRRDLPAQRSAAAEPPASLDGLAEALAHVHPGLPVTAHTLVGSAAAVLRRMSAGASLLVVGASGSRDRHPGAGSVARSLFAGAACPVLVRGRGEGFGGGGAAVVVAHAAGDLDDDAVGVVDVGAAEAVRRGTALLLVHPYRLAAGEAGARALRRARGATADALQALGLGRPGTSGVRVTSVHTTTPAGRALATHARAADLVVVGAQDVAAAGPLLREQACDVVVVPRGVELRREAARAVYRGALLDELARSAARGDGCSTPEELDDAWRVGVASPAVGERVALAWRACLQGAAAAVGAGRRGDPR